MNRVFQLRTAFCLFVLLCPLLSFAADSSEEQSLISVLQSDASPREKDAACSQLKRIGTVKSVPALAALLTDEKLSRSARNALESMPNAEAGAALLAALPKTSGPLEVGIINSLAVRQEKAAVAPLSGLLSEANSEVGVAASEGLGLIGGAEALNALESAAPASSEIVNEARLDALLTIANRLLTQGDASTARKTFQRIYDSGKSDSLRDAAFRGLILSSGREGIELMASAIAGTDSARQGAALQLASSLKGETVTKTLADLLPRTQPAVQIALLHCLAQRGDSESMQAVASQIDSPDADVRIAAITTLGDLGDGTVAVLLAKKAAESTGVEKAAARQSLLDLRRGAATSAMIAAIADADLKVRLELLRALGSRGDKLALAKLVELAQADDDATRAASCQALSSLAGPAQIGTLIELVANAKSDDARTEAAESLGVVYQRIQSETGHADASPLATPIGQGPIAARLVLLPVCAGLNDPAAREIMRIAVKDADLQVREAAIAALCDTHDPEMLPDLIQLAQTSQENKFRVMAVGGVVRLMMQEERVEIPLDKKLESFKTILDGKLGPAERRMILGGLGAVPDERALAMSLPFLDDPEVRPEAARAVMQIAVAIYIFHPEASGGALKKVLDVTTDADTQNAAKTALHKIQELSMYVTGWQISGPYTKAGKDYAALFDIAFPPETPNDSSAKWQPVPFGTDPAQPWKLDLLKALGGEQRVAYARTWIYAPEATPARLEIGADDGLKVWFNGQLIHGNNVSRGFSPGSDRMDVTLQKGWNPVVLKITQNTGGWEFSARVVNPNGEAIPGVKISATPPT